MKVEITENNRKIQQVAATMAIEDMYMSKDCLQGLIDVANGTCLLYTSPSPRDRG